MHSSTDKLVIGPIELRPPVLLAPMAGYTDLPFRSAVRKLGGLGLAYTEMLNPRSFMMSKNKKIAHLLATSDDDTPLVHQIYGREPEVMAEGARWLQDRGASAIDINMGCPSRKIAQRGAGAGLLREPELAVTVARRTVESVDIPVTAKIRTGWTEDQPVAVELARNLEDVGIAAIAVHPRDRKQGFAGVADWQVIADVVNAVKTIPIIGNGDITSAQAAGDMLEQTGCAGVMIGRYALKYPWIIRQTAAHLADEVIPPAPTRAEHVQFMQQHLQGMASEYGDDLAARLFRRWTPQYSKTLPIGRKEMIHILSMDDIESLSEAISELE